MRLNLSQKQLADTADAVVGTADDLTGQAVHAYVCMKEESDYSKAPEKEAELKKALGIQVRKVIGPFAAPKKIVSDSNVRCKEYLVDVMVF